MQRSSKRTILFATAMAIICCAVCFAAAGASLDFYIGCVLLVVLFCPALMTGETRGAWIAAGAICLVVTIGWGSAGRSIDVTVVQWLKCSLVLASVIGVCVTGTRMLMRWKIAPMLAAAMITTVQSLWLTWPIWLSPSIPGSTCDWLVWLHPMLAINGQLKDQGIWTEQPLAYGLTTLGQDIEYQLPASAWPAIGFNLVLIGIFVLFSQQVRRDNFAIGSQ